MYVCIYVEMYIYLLYVYIYRDMRVCIDHDSTKVSAYPKPKQRYLPKEFLGVVNNSSHDIESTRTFLEDQMKHKKLGHIPYPNEPQNLGHVAYLISIPTLHMNHEPL